MKKLLISAILAIVAIVGVQASNTWTISFPSNVTATLISATGGSVWVANDNGELIINNLYDHTNTVINEGDQVEFLTRNDVGSVYAASFRNGHNVQCYHSNGTPIGPSVVTPLVAKAVTVSPNGDLIATACDDTYPIAIWDTASGEIVATLPGTMVAPRVQFVGNNKLAVLETTSNKSLVKIWNITTGRQLKHWSIDSNGHGLAVSSNGERIATLNGPESATPTAVRAWNLQGKLIKKIADKETTQTTAIFDPEGGVMIGNFAGTVRSYDGKRYQFIDETVVAGRKPVSDISVDRQNFRAAASSGTAQVTFRNR